MLEPEQVELWSISLDAPSRELRRLQQTLCAAERERAARFVFKRHRRRFVVAHDALRRILAGYVDVAAERLELEAGPHGKPALTPACGGDRLRFNLTHSHELALVAVGCGRELGVDVEHIRPLPDLEAIATRHFAAAEVEELLAMPPGNRTGAFFRCWTRKEAYLKALGDGLARPLGGFRVTLVAEAPARLVEVEGLPDEPRRWSLQHLDPAPAYVGALAFEGSGCEVKPRRWPDG